MWGYGLQFQGELADEITLARCDNFVTLLTNLTQLGDTSGVLTEYYELDKFSRAARGLPEDKWSPR